ncbi:MAG: hypothetical protein HW403_1110 [Dehalococcoidia bacterium]|nr:hypothetical protein [Dehalococcoidia bacterium]
MERLEQLKEAQRRVNTLRSQGVSMTSQEARQAMNRLMGLLRGASPEELAAFSLWKAEEDQRLGQA